MSVGEESRMKVEEVEVNPFVIKIDFLEEESGRLKEANGRLTRLRVYNGELRHALVKGQSLLDSVIQIPDVDSHLFDNESVAEISQTLQSFDAVVFNPIVMDLVFKKLDLKTIKKCRLICKNWDESVSRILSRQNGGYGLAVRLEEGKLKGMTDAFRQHTIQGLSSVVAYAPQHWFRKALLDDSFITRTEIQYVLQNFGDRLRSIEITGSELLFQDVHKILAEWCPNLEQLALPPRLYTLDRLEGYQQKLAFSRPLKLTSLFMQEQLCMSVVKASANLKTLSLSCDSDEYRPFPFFEQLQKCPNVTRNLENLTVTIGRQLSTITHKLKVFNSIQFSRKLKTFTIVAVGRLPTKELSEALKKLGGPLEKLVVSLHDILDHGMAGMDPDLVFPGMDNLTELRYFTVTTMPTNSIEMLTGMPNLIVLYLGQHVDLTVKREYFIDNLFSDCQQLRRSPQKKLKELYLFGIVQSPPTTFEMMNTFFPNLTKLVVGIFVRRLCNDWEELKNYYTGVLDGGLSELVNLKHLYLDFRRPNPDDEEAFDYMSVIFNQLNKLPNLTHLTIRDNSKSSTALVGDKLVEISNLRQVTLIGLKLDGLTAKELTVLLYKHDIQLQIEDTELEEDFRVHFEEKLTFRRRKCRFH